MMSSVNHDDFAHLKIPLENILTATNNFDDENFRGGSRFGNHYAGQLLWSGESIGIHAQRWNKEWDEKEQQFWMEISTLSALEHKNLVSLVGFCDENDEKIIIIELEAMFSLDNYLGETMMLTWLRRLEICVGVVHALSYIHYDEHRHFSVLHGNIDSDTILLNENLEPKLSEFRLSMKIEASQRHHSFRVDKVWDWEGYTDPTYEKTKIAHHKSDIYSFGVVMFELACGRKSVTANDTNKYLAPVAITHYREKKLHEIIDWDLWEQMDSQAFNIFTETAYDCLNEERLQRPHIDEIVTRLEKALELQLEHQKAIMCLPNNKFAHLQVPLQNILSATKNFAQENDVRDYGYVKEYKGHLLWSGELIHITARRFNKECTDQEQLFWTEISMLPNLKHKNLVSLVGFCDENDEKIIIIRNETARGMLFQYLSDSMMLTWVRRLEICVGLAHALSYIHYDEPRDFSVIHRSIDSSRVLLNDKWEPKLGSFECSMKIKASQRHHSFHTHKSMHLIGYGDPTYIETKRVNHKSDIYSFGIVLFELLCGRISIIDDKDDNHLAPLAIIHYREKKLKNMINQDLLKQMDLHSFNMFSEIAYECLDEELTRRPNIDDIVPRLEKALELARVNRPIRCSPNHLADLRIPLEDIESATNYFDEKNVIGEGGFGKRCEGKFFWSGEMIDITARRLTNKEWDEEKEQKYWTEISMLSSLKHKNVVSIVGFCNEVGAETIIYKRNSRGRLDGYLSDPMLTWVKRLEISVSVAHALGYIHYDEPRDFSVIHRNISSYTVELNNDWEPTLWEFQHSMKIKASERHRTFHTDSIWSTKGYTDPTCLETRSVNHKSDIYSFGIVLFELLCGRKSVIDDHDNKYLAAVAMFHYREKTLDDIIDPDLLKQMDRESLNVFAKTAYDNLNEERSRRPDIVEVFKRLEEALKLQLARENRLEHSIVATKAEGTSSNHDKESVTFISTNVESHVSKKTMSSVKDLSNLKLSFQDIAYATNNFGHENIITQFRHGTIFKGRLLHSQQFIDITAKKFFSSDIKRESKKIWTEIFMLCSLNHKNLVSIIGLCDEEHMKIIIYNTVNKSLQSYLKDRTLKWMQRLKICVGVAKALSYIHYDVGRDFSVIHCNIRSSKILLDDEWEPKLSGFELSLKNAVTTTKAPFPSAF